MTETEIKNADGSKINWSEPGLSVAYDPADDKKAFGGESGTRLGVFRVSNGAVLHDWINAGDVVRGAEGDTGRLEPDILAELLKRGFDLEQLQGAVDDYFCPVDSKKAWDFLVEKCQARDFGAYHVVLLDDASGSWWVTEYGEIQWLGARFRDPGETKPFESWRRTTYMDPMPPGWCPAQREDETSFMISNSNDRRCVSARNPRRAALLFLAGYDCEDRPGPGVLVIGWGLPDEPEESVFQVEFRTEGDHQITSGS